MAGYMGDCTEGAWKYILQYPGIQAWNTISHRLTVANRSMEVGSRLLTIRISSSSGRVFNKIGSFSFSGLDIRSYEKPLRRVS